MKQLITLPETRFLFLDTFSLAFNKRERVIIVLPGSCDCYKPCTKIYHLKPFYLYIFKTIKRFHEFACFVYVNFYKKLLICVTTFYTQGQDCMRTLYNKMVLVIF